MNEADIPIDIHTVKLHDWLISRRIVPKNIQPYIKDIRNKINDALKDMPSIGDDATSLYNANINYFQCKNIIETLKETEKDSKSLFGSYRSQRMKDWQEIMRLYEKENIYLGEAAQICVRNITYGIPATKKQIAKYEKQSEEALKKSHDLARPEKQILQEHTILLKQLGLKGENLRDEFYEVLKQIPSLYTESIGGIGDLKESVELYRKFARDCPIIRHLIEFGNSTVYHYIHKEPPIEVVENPINLNLEDNKDADNECLDIKDGDNGKEIDFGTDDNGDSSTTSAELIDFGELNADTPGDVSADIDWGFETDPLPDNDFDVTVKEYEIVVEGSGVDAGVARGNEAYSILDSPKHREKFICELLELASFLRMRIYEDNQESFKSMFMYALFDDIPQYDADTLERWLQKIHDILEKVESEKVRHLYQLKHSPKYAEILASNLRSTMKRVEKIRSTKEALKQQSVELKQRSEDLKPALEELIKQTKVLQDHIEQDISKRYKNRPVNLLGGINAL